MSNDPDEMSAVRETDDINGVDDASVVIETTTDMSDTEKGNPIEPPIRENPVRNIHGVKWVVVVVSILSSTFLFALDNTVVADVQPQIVLQFDAIDQIAWLSVAFIMGALSFTLLYGQLYSQLLPKWLYIVSVVVFEIGSAVCGAAPNSKYILRHWSTFCSPDTQTATSRTQQEELSGFNTAKTRLILLKY